MCLSPIDITRDYGFRKRIQTVPCGRCIECKVSSQRDIASRSVTTCRRFGNVWFITLTYNEDSVPIVFDLDGEVVDVCRSTGEFIVSPIDSHRSLRREDLKLWKKRVKIAYKRKFGHDLCFHYLLCGEYGPRTHRPHYHGLLVGLSDVAASMLARDWEEHFGFVCFKKIYQFDAHDSKHDNFDAVAKYVSKYVVKPSEFEDELVLTGKVEKPRRITSVGFGEPSPSEFRSMQNYYLCRDMFDYNPDTLSSLSRFQVRTLLNEIINRKSIKPISRYYVRKIFYKRIGSSVKRTTLQTLVSQFVQLHADMVYNQKFRQIRASLPDMEDMEKDDAASRLLYESETAERQARFKAYHSYQKRCFAKSRF